jgi:hypothetical protein
MLTLHGSLTTAGVAYSTLWADDFADAAFARRLAEWLDRGRVEHALDHVKPLASVKIGAAERDLGSALSSPITYSTPRAYSRNASAKAPSTTRPRK